MYCRHCLLSFFKLTANVFGLCVRAGFGAQNCQPALKLNRSTKLQICTSPRLTPNPCYRFVLLFCRVVVCSCCSVLVRWLGGSFAKLGFSVGLCGFANVPPKALAILLKCIFLQGCLFLEN